MLPVLDTHQKVFEYIVSHQLVQAKKSDLHKVCGHWRTLDKKTGEFLYCPSGSLFRELPNFEYDKLPVASIESIQHCEKYEDKKHLIPAKKLIDAGLTALKVFNTDPSLRPFDYLLLEILDRVHEGYKPRDWFEAYKQCCKDMGLEFRPYALIKVGN